MKRREEEVSHLLPGDGLRIEKPAVIPRFREVFATENDDVLFIDVIGCAAIPLLRRILRHSPFEMI